MTAMSSSTDQLNNEGLIHKTAIISPAARLGQKVSVGAYSIIEADTQIGDNTCIGSHVVIQKGTNIGCNNQVYQFASIGSDSQDKKHTGKATKLLIGDSNIIREYATINRGSDYDEGKTVIGDGNWFMAYTHVAHDCIVGNHTVFSNGAMLAGHVKVGDYATLSAFVLVHQFCRIGRYSFVAPTTIIRQDLTPFTRAWGSPAKTYSLNKVGLERAKFTPDLIAALHACYRKLVKGPHNGTESGEGQELDKLASQYPEVEEFIRFVKDSKRRILR